MLEPFWRFCPITLPVSTAGEFGCVGLVSRRSVWGPYRAGVPLTELVSALWADLAVLVQDPKCLLPPRPHESPACCTES